MAKTLIKVEFSPAQKVTKKAINESAEQFTKDIETDKLVETYLALKAMEEWTKIAMSNIKELATAKAKQNIDELPDDKTVADHRGVKYCITTGKATLKYPADDIKLNKLQVKLDTVKFDVTQRQSFLKQRGRVKEVAGTEVVSVTIPKE